MRLVSLAAHVERDPLVEAGGGLWDRGGGQLMGTLVDPCLIAGCEPLSWDAAGPLAGRTSRPGRGCLKYWFNEHSHVPMPSLCQQPH